MTDQYLVPNVDEAWRTALDACVAGFPLLVLDAARRAHPAGPNQFVHARAGETLIGLCAPNPHVVYSSAWLDLRDGPVIVSLPDLRARHFAMPMIDAWGSIFTSMGVRRRGEAAQHLVVVGPHWSGAATDDVPVVRAPTNAVWLLGRTLTDAFDDGAEGPWDEFYLTLKGRRTPAPAASPIEPQARPAWPATEFLNLDAEDFLTRMAGLMDVHPAPPTRWPLAQRLARIGVNRGAPVDLSHLPREVASAVRAGVAEGLARIDTAAWPQSALASGWSALARPGDGRLEPLARAAIARRGFGFNLQEDVTYFLACQDADGAPLDGRTDYRLRFEPQRLPPVGACWSLAAYRPDGSLAIPEGPGAGLSSREPRRFDLDGSLELLIQRRKPAGPRVMNWLPTPDGPFHLVLRACWPGRAILDGRWSPPPIVRSAAERPAWRDQGRTGPSPSGGTPASLRDRPDSSTACHP